MVTLKNLTAKIRLLSNPLHRGDRRNKGQFAERRACRYLQRQGLTLVAKNYRCANGEIDLIMRDKEQLVFVEVRYRENKHYGTGIDSVDSKKIKKLILTARHYLASHQLDVPARFDIVGLDASLNPERISDAFNTH